MCHFYVLLVVGLFLTVACDRGKEGVTRSRAQTDIQKSTAFSTGSGLLLELTGESLKCGSEKGMWKNHGQGIEFTRDGRKYFTRIVQDFPVVQGPPRLAVEVPGNHDRRVWTVMAIRDAGPSRKQVYAFWEWKRNKLPMEVLACFGNEDSNVSAVFATYELFNRGWRFPELAIGPPIGFPKANWTSNRFPEG
jgi:hypothetical protein